MWLKKHWKIFAFGGDTLIPPQYKFCHSVCVQNPEWSKNYTISKKHLDSQWLLTAHVGILILETVFQSLEILKTQSSWHW